MWKEMPARQADAMLDTATPPILSPAHNVAILTGRTPEGGSRSSAYSFKPAPAIKVATSHRLLAQRPDAGRSER
jgi:hypothetical protein